MIVRYALKCETCEQPHTVRIGLGQDASQTHKFRCRGCSEEIVLRMDLDYAKHGWSVVCVENCGPIEEVVGAPIVNVDANFTIPPEQQGLDMVFPRFAHTHAMHEAAERTGSLVDMSDVPATARWRQDGRPPERCDPRPSGCLTGACHRLPSEYRLAAPAEGGISLTTAGSRVCRGCLKAKPRSQRSTGLSNAHPRRARRNSSGKD
jgi:hypothetical protein